ncbi:MAG: hypothetical protein H0W96_15675 [Solirubrobacterales bacterium]|nr:hypothetical protein [Solirubrobacterales bacterium]
MRRRWTVEALLDERAELLRTLDGLEHARAKFTTQATERVVGKPAARDGVEAMMRKVQRKFDQGTEIVRPRLLIGDSILSSRGVTPWKDEKS